MLSSCSGVVELAGRHIWKLSGRVGVGLARNGRENKFGIEKPKETEVSRGFGCLD